MKEIAYDFNGKSEYRYNRDDFDDLFHGDHIWIAFVVGNLKLILVFEAKKFSELKISSNC